MVHKVGDKVFVDFSGKHLQIVDKKSGEIKDVEVFVAVLISQHNTFFVSRFI